jgi:hypothetical protein
VVHKSIVFINLNSAVARANYATRPGLVLCCEALADSPDG